MHSFVRPFVVAKIFFPADFPGRMVRRKLGCRENAKMSTAGIDAADLISEKCLTLQSFSLD